MIEFVAFNISWNSGIPLPINRVRQNLKFHFSLTCAKLDPAIGLAHSYNGGGQQVSFYLAGLIVILLLKTFVHNRSDDGAEWIRRVLELPADASILSLMAVVAASATRTNTDGGFGLWLLLEITCVLVGIVLYKYCARNISDQTGQIQYDNFALFLISFFANCVVAVISIAVVWHLKVF